MAGLREEAGQEVTELTRSKSCAEQATPLSPLPPLSPAGDPCWTDPGVQEAGVQGDLTPHQEAQSGVQSVQSDLERPSRSRTLRRIFKSLKNLLIQS